MKALKWIGGIIVALLAILVIGGLMLPADYTVTRSVQIAAPADKVYALLEDPRAWKRWTVWNRRDPSMQITYSGPATGAGAGWAWQSETEGSGSMTFTRAEPGQRLAYELSFPEFDSTSTGDLLLTPVENGTRVTWTLSGNMGANPLMHWFALMMDRMVGPDFEAGLGQLKTEAEKT